MLTSHKLGPHEVSNIGIVNRKQYNLFEDCEFTPRPTVGYQYCPCPDCEWNASTPNSECCKMLHLTPSNMLAEEQDTGVQYIPKESMKPNDEDPY